MDAFYPSAYAAFLHAVDAPESTRERSARREIDALAEEFRAFPDDQILDRMIEAELELDSAGMG